MGISISRYANSHENSYHIHKGSSMALHEIINLSSRFSTGTRGAAITQPVVQSSVKAVNIKLPLHKMYVLQLAVTFCHSENPR